MSQGRARATTSGPKHAVRYRKRRFTIRNTPFAIRNDGFRSETYVGYTKQRFPIRNAPFAIRNNGFRSETRRLLYETTVPA